MKPYNGIHIKNFDLKSISSFKIGGIALDYFIPNETNDLIQFLKYAAIEKKSIYIIGNASNILFNDIIYKGTLINLKGFTNFISQNKNIITAGAAVHLDNLIEYSINNSLKGIEKLSGIPGTVGGALVMNAGAFGSEIGDHVESVKVMTYSGKVKVLTKDQIKFTYRKSVPLEKYIILEAVFRLKKGSQSSLINRRKEVLKKRGGKQPLEYPSCGSIFKRPENNYAGALIERSDLKGVKIGGAQISKKHCNFIINAGNAKADEVMQLIQLAQKKVYNNFKIKLELEIKLFNF
ncbi:MAG: UDP-N-acetylmuramate dehydrogenase [Spirochaetes bacterium]|nr:UDP-N-acetylmuramate dehydrogenase [Spirochaetota bacterium]